MEVAGQYLQGLIQAPKKNMERMAEKVVDTSDQRLQHFVSNSPWDERGVIDQIAQDGNGHLGGKPNSALYIDETGFAKKGKESVGVQRQWVGRLGKVENSQCGVFAALGCEEHVLAIDFRLYLPESWTQDKERCLDAGVPKEQMVFKRKHDLALEMVAHARSEGIGFNWVGVDGFYGSDPEFLRSLDQMGETFVADVHKDQGIYLEDPAPVVPPCKSKRGRKPERLKAQSPAIRVDKWAEAEQHWKTVPLRDSTKGELIVEVLHKHVWLWDGEEQEARKWHVIVRREPNAQTKRKFTLINAPDDTPIERLAYMQGQRYWIERAFQDAKDQCGMADYQVRGWRGWHHHMTMVMLAMLFILEERLFNKTTLPLLSAADVVKLLEHFLPKKDITEEEILRQMHIRHKKRQASIDSAYRKLKPPN
jgi:SRSO17 transposase